MVYKKRVLRKARRRGAFINFTARRTNQISLEIDLNASTGPDVAHLYNADKEWYGHSKEVKFKQDKYKHHCLKSISFKFSNFKVRTCIRTETTEGGSSVMPARTTTREQFLEPRWINMRYKWNKWGDKINPGHMVGTDDRIEEIMQTKTIRNSKDKFWGIFKPKGGICLDDGPVDGDHSWGPYVNRMRCRNFDEKGPPHLAFWFCAEQTLPSQFFAVDGPVTRTAKIFIDFTATFYTKWFCSVKRLEYI
jgi:hypothetical protein